MGFGSNAEYDEINIKKKKAKDVQLSRGATVHIFKDILTLVD